MIYFWRVLTKSRKMLKISFKCTKIMLRNSCYGIVLVHKCSIFATWLTIHPFFVCKICTTNVLQALINKTQGYFDFSFLAVCVFFFNERNLYSYIKFTDLIFRFFNTGKLSKKCQLLRYYDHLNSLNCVDWDILN